MQKTDNEGPFMLLLIGFCILFILCCRSHCIWFVEGWRPVLVYHFLLYSSVIWIVLEFHRLKCVMLFDYLMQLGSNQLVKLHIREVTWMSTFWAKKLLDKHYKMECKGRIFGDLRPCFKCFWEKKESCLSVCCFVLLLKLI